MIKNKNAGMIVGFLLIFFGLTGIILSLVGFHWFFFAWLEKVGGLFAFVTKILMVIAGVVVFYLSRMDWDEEMRESQ